jgi:hypothetical protein
MPSTEAGPGLAHHEKMNRKTRTVWTHAAGLLLPTLVGCAPNLQSAAKDVTQGAVPAAIDSSLETLAEQRTRERVLQLMSSPEMQKTLEAMATSFTKGATKVLTSDEMAKSSSELTSSIARAATRVAVDAAMSEMASPENERRLTDLMTAATAAATRSAMASMADELRRSLGPALGDVVRDNVAPSVRGMMTDPETRSTVGAIAFEASREAVLGSNDAMAELERKRNKQGTLARLSGLLEHTELLLGFVVVAVCAIVGLLVAFLSTRSKLKHARLAEVVDGTSAAPPRRGQQEDEDVEIQKNKGAPGSSSARPGAAGAY